MAHVTDDDIQLPHEPVQKLIAPFVHFMAIESTSGILLLVCSIAALVLANLPVGEAWLAFWETPLGLRIGGYEIEHSIQHWINDGLMTIFFFVIGLEVKREIVLGELRDIRRAALPIVAALGGMVVPAAIYFALMRGTEAERGWGIPMATDIAFVVGCMTVLGSRVPAGLRVMLLTLAIADDIGAILVIAFGYTQGLNAGWMIASAVGIGIVFVAQRLGIRSIRFYMGLGVAIWFCVYESGVHATIAGVILGLLTPARPYLKDTQGAELLERAVDMIRSKWESIPTRAGNVHRLQRATRETISPLEYLEYRLHSWVAFAIMPLFALANAGVRISLDDLGSSVAVAVILGLAVGKPIGIFFFSYGAVMLRIAQLPTGVLWRHVWGGGMLGGIGFTMALFVASLALKGQLLNEAKLGILAGSLLSAFAGSIYMILIANTVKAHTPEPEPLTAEA